MLTLLLALPAALPTDSFTLDLTDALLGTATATPAVEHLGIVPGHPLRFEFSGPSLQPVLLYTSLDLPGSLPLGSGTLDLDPGTAILLGVEVLDLAGAAALELTVPPGLPLGIDLRSQAFRLELETAAVEPSNSLTHATCDLQGTVIVASDASVHPLGWTGGVEVIEDAASWAAFWDLHDAFIPPTPLPPVDFDRDVVIASFYGVVGTTGYGFELDQVVAGPGSLTLEHTLNAPGIGCGGGFSMGFPHVFLVVDRVAAAASVTIATQTVLGDPCP